MGELRLGGEIVARWNAGARSRVVVVVSTVRFRVLGSVGVSVDGVPISIGAPRQRALLALLLMDANRPLHPHVLIDCIWGDATPQHPDAALQIVVSRLRNALGPIAERLTSEPGGYRIDVTDDEVDHLRARRNYVRAQERWAQHDFAGAADAADAALDCWSADAFADLRDAHFYDAAYGELRELRFAIYEFRNRAYLRCGRHVEVLADIEAWIRLEPWREGFRALQMVALYRAGRRVDALAVYEDLRRCLADELGVEPSRFVQDVYGRVLDQDPTLLARRAGIISSLPAWTSLALPFVGRSREELRIFDSLQEVAAGATRMVLVEGEAGIGKSRLIIEVARRVRDEAIVLSVDGADVLRPGMQRITAALTEASSHLSDAELGLCLGRWPGDVADVAPALRRRLPGLPPALEADDETRAARLRAAIVSWIGGLSQRAPVILLVDDVHRAGPALLTLLGALLVDTEPKRVLVLATARSGIADRSSRLEQLARSLQDRDVVTRIELEGLLPDSVERLLAGLALPDAQNLAAQLTLTTRGHPYLLGEMLREPDCGAAPATVDDVSSRIRSFVLHRVASLGEPASRLLNIAAAIDGEFDIDLLVDATRGTAGSTEVLVDQAINAGLVHVTGLGSFDFVHDLARRSIAEAVDDAARVSVHRGLALVLEQRDAPAALIASQWSRAGDAADHPTRVWSERAGDEALRNLDPHSAAAWYEVASERADDERTRAHLLVCLADAQCQAGEKEGGDTLRRALEIARRLDDGDLLVEAATLWTPIWGSMPTLSSDERVSVLSEASDRARAGAVRAQLLARLATQLTHTREWRRARSLADEAVAEARRADDVAILSEVLMRHFYATCSPHNLDERLRYMPEALAIETVGHDPMHLFFALSAAAFAAIEAAQIDDADGYLERAFALGRELDVPVLTYNMECIRVWRTGLRGHLADAEELALNATRLGTQYGIPYAALGPTLQLGGIRWQVGRFGELLPMMRLGASTGDLGSAVLLARALACFDDTKAEGVEVLERAATDGFEDLALGMHWAGCLVGAAEASFMLANERVGRVVLRLLEPFAEQMAFNGSWVTAPIAYGAGLAAAAAGEAVADDLFEHAIEMSIRMGAPVLRARSEIAWSRALMARGGDSRKVLSLGDDARETLAEYHVDAIARSAESVHAQASDALSRFGDRFRSG